MIIPQIPFFQNIKIKLKSRTWMTLKSSLVIFQALEPLQPQQPHRPLQPQWPQQSLKPYFIKELPDLDDWIVPGTKMTNAGPFLWNGSSKIQFFTDFSTFSAQGCWGQPMLLFENWFKKLKCPNLLKSLGTIFQQNYWSFYTSEHLL